MTQTVRPVAVRPVVEGPAVASRVRRRRIPTALPAVLLGLTVLACWVVLTSFGVVPATVLPSPGAVAGAVVDLAATGDLGEAIRYTTSTAAGGAVLGSLVALPLAWFIVHSALAAAALEPYIAASQAIPAIAIAPVLVVWFGYGRAPVIVLCALLVFFPIVIATTLGLHGIDRDVMAAARVDGAGTWDLLRWIEAPLALSGILAGLRAGVTLAMTGAVVGEFVIGGGLGLGVLLVALRDRVDIAGMFAVLTVLVAIAVTAYALIRVLEHRREYT